MEHPKLDRHKNKELDRLLTKIKEKAIEIDEEVKGRSTRNFSENDPSDKSDLAVKERLDKLEDMFREELEGPGEPPEFYNHQIADEVATAWGCDKNDIETRLNSAIARLYEELLRKDMSKLAFRLLNIAKMICEDENGEFWGEIMDGRLFVHDPETTSMWSFENDLFGTLRYDEEQKMFTGKYTVEFMLRVVHMEDMDGFLNMPGSTVHWACALWATMNIRAIGSDIDWIKQVIIHEKTHVYMGEKNKLRL